MITDARVLQPAFIPREVKHRGTKIEVLTNSLEPVTDGDSGETTLIFGPSGVGKTCISRYVVDELRENALGVETQYVNAWEDHSRFTLLYRILEGLGRTFDVHRQSTPTDELLERIRAYDDDQYVVIVDEVDQLEDKSLLYDLYHVSNLTMILIGNREEEFLSGLDQRLSSRLSSGSRIHFDPYNHDELVSILEDRVRWGLEPGSIDDAQLSVVADAAAGDARKAIAIVRHAAKSAHRDHAERINDDRIRAAIPEATSALRQKSLGKLTTDQRALYDIIEAEGEVAPGHLYERYRETVSDPKSERTMRNHLRKLEHYNLVASAGATRSRTYSVK